MKTLRTLKKLLFGETWLLPLGIAATLVVSGVLHRVAPHLWSRVGGPLMLGGVMAVLIAAVALTGRRHRA